ncbi:MAG: response regulator [Candidatus Omnitrophota bacterium]
MKKILVVDDEKEIRELIKEKLSKSDFNILTASNGKEAVEICKAEQPDLVLLDVAMPQMDGYQACQKLRDEKKTRNIPVLFLTGKDLAPESVLERCNTLSASGFVSKLSTLEELLKKIEEVLKT